MAGPWEKYQQQAVPTGPWAKYAQPQKAEQPGMLERAGSALKSAGEAAHDFADQFRSQGMMFGLGDEAFGALNTPIEMGIRAFTGEDAGKGLGERISGAYTEGRDAVRARDKAAQERSPIASGAGELAGALTTGGTLAKGGMTLLNAGKSASGAGKVARAGAAAEKVVRGAGEGAAYGSVHGYGKGEGLDDSIAGAVHGGTWGAATGGAVPLVAPVVGAAGRKVMERQARKTIPTTDAITRQSDRLYTQAKRSGVTLTPQTSVRLADDLKTALDDAAFHPRIHPKVAAAFDDIVSDAGNPLDLQRVDHLRRITKAAANSNEADERRVAGIVIDKLDEFMDNLTPQDVTGASPGTATAMLKQARGLWSSKRKDEMIGDAVERAIRRAESTGSGGNVDNAIRQNIRSILDNPKKRRGFSGEERALMENIVRGGKGQNLLRLIGKLSPSGNGLMAALGLGATVANPMMAAAPAAGMMAKSVADRITPHNVSKLSDVVRSGGQLPPARQLTAVEQQILDSMLTGSIQQGHRAEPVLSPVLPFAGSP